MSFLHSAGTATQTGMGLVALSWQEIEAWQRCNDYIDTVSPWELSVIKKLSEAYTSEYSLSSDKARPRPWIGTIKEEEIDRKAISDKAKMVLSMFMKK